MKILLYCVDISKVNARLLYRHQCNQLQVLQKKQMSLLMFISKIAEGLGSANKVPRGVGRPSKRKATGDVPAARHKPSQPLPCNDARYDGMHHWPEYRSNKLNCRLCKVGNSRVYCKKRKICLCNEQYSQLLFSVSHKRKLVENCSVTIKQIQCFST